MIDAPARAYAISSTLAPCVRGCIGHGTEPDTRRASHFPATASCCLVWLLEGRLSRTPGAPPPPSRVLFRGPQRQPVRAWSEGPVRLFFLLLMPDALRAMTGIDANHHLDRIGAAEPLFDAPWRELMQRVAAANDDAERVRCIEAFLLPRWAACSGGTGAGWASSCRHAEWSRALAQRAAVPRPGGSTRQVERRVRQWSGQSMRSLRNLARAEGSLLVALQRLGGGKPGRINWADVAAQCGYADQSHLGREWRRLTGFSPQELLRRLHADEAMWPYRAWCSLQR